MREIVNSFFTSGYDFDESQMNLKGRYQMLNAGILVSTMGLIYGIIGNIIRSVEGLIAIESGILLMNFILIGLLRKDRKLFDLVVIIMTTQFTFLFMLLIYISEPEAMKHAWLFTYPIILLYLQDTKKGLYWLFFLILMLIMAPLQNFVEVKYSLYQVTYLSFVLIITHTIIYFYQLKMLEAKNKILEQQNLLRDFNSKLEDQVDEKVVELRELNESLEVVVKDKMEELIQKDKILTVQSKQAVMGEMISMIAHQWRQPLSTITLQIANLQFKKLLGQDLSHDDADDALSDISDTILYLSETIDDFQTYFRPDKEMVEVSIHDLLQRAVNFTLSRIKERNIDIVISVEEDIYIKTYANEFVQVILNILNNAIDALNETNKTNPSIHISAKIVENFILIDIADNADGIKDENMSQLFEPYFSTKGKNGTGLGLYMSQMIVQKQFSGDISVKSSKDGSTFTIKLPKYPL